MILDLADNKAKPFDADITDPAMEGSFKLSGLEIGADDLESVIFSLTEGNISPR